MITKASKNSTRLKRHLRMRKKLVGTTERPRLNVYRSLNNIYAQLIDDVKGVTLVSASTLDKELKDNPGHGGNKGAAKEVGTLVAKKAIEAGIKQVVFDRGGYIYHGRVKELADAAREAGLEF
ncbi:MAG: 50S ribosomal protein L18 [Clostridia bacterium BRH_c25]|nr:MAG: 50S ribosomal protein L18 [Clostridia bacterium BRH_c25]